MVMQTVVINLAEALELNPELIKDFLLVKVGDSVFSGEVIAQKKKLFGLNIRKVKSPVTGVIKSFSEFDGKLSIQTDDVIDNLPELEIKDSGEDNSKKKTQDLKKKSKQPKPESKHFVRPSTKNCIPTELIVNSCQGEGFLLSETFSDDIFDAKLSGKIVMTRVPLNLRQVYRASAVGIVGIVFQGLEYMDQAVAIKDQIDNKIQLAFCLISKEHSLKKLHKKDLFIDNASGRICY